MNFTGSSYIEMVLKLLYEESVMRGLIATLLITMMVALMGVGQAEADQTLLVFGAASLTEFLQEVGPIFEQQHKGTTVRLNLTSSSRLRIQIEQGAPADVFLSANMAHMDPLVKAGLAEKSDVFAHNRLVIVVPRSNPGKLDTPADLAKSGLTLVIATSETPIGRYTRESIGKMDACGRYGDRFEERVLANVRSNEPTVKAVVAKVHLGEADAGVCYSSDITPTIRADVKVIAIPDDVNIVADYPIARLAGAREKALAADFVRFVLSPEGQRLLEKHGFIPARPAK
ncbi:MAG: molybdate ABC transporter substrate-binding protein [Armatimonadetes bacterium]|nr:molybdate ABC transporter substrate-binding protein [Armatimonadota bacterium]